MPLIYVDTLEDPRLDAFARLTEAQLRSKLEPERALFIAESQKVIERAFEGGMEPISLLMEEKWLPSMAPLIERMEKRTGEPDQRARGCRCSWRPMTSLSGSPASS